MADDFVLHKIQGSSASFQTDGTRIIQAGSINNINTSGVEPRDIFYKVLDICRNNGYSLSEPTTVFSAEHPNLILRRVEITGYTTDGLDFLFYWEVPQFGPPTIYQIRKSTILSPYQTDLLPGTRVPLRIADTVVAGGWTVEGDNVLFNFLKPLEQISVYALMYGQPRYAGNKVGRVNDANWPTAGPSLPLFGGHSPLQEQKAKGYWLLSEWESREDKYAGYYTVSAGALSRVDEDWSYSATLIDTATGKRVKLVNADLTAANMMNLPYIYGMIWNDEGMMRVGPYQTTDFTAAMGF